MGHVVCSVGNEFTEFAEEAFRAGARVRRDRSQPTTPVVLPWLSASVDIQHVTNPTHNQDRGPVWTPSLRVHVEFGNTHSPETASIDRISANGLSTPAPGQQFPHYSGVAPRLDARRALTSESHERCTDERERPADPSLIHGSPGIPRMFTSLRMLGIGNPHRSGRPFEKFGRQLYCAN